MRAGQKEIGEKVILLGSECNTLKLDEKSKYGKTLSSLTNRLLKKQVVRSRFCFDILAISGLWAEWNLLHILASNLIRKKLKLQFFSNA